MLVAFRKFKQCFPFLTSVLRIEPLSCIFILFNSPWHQQNLISQSPIMNYQKTSKNVFRESHRGSRLVGAAMPNISIISPLCLNILPFFAVCVCPFNQTWRSRDSIREESDIGKEQQQSANATVFFFEWELGRVFYFTLFLNMASEKHVLPNFGSLNLQWYVKLL